MAGGKERPLLHNGLAVSAAFKRIARDCLQRFSANAQQFGDVEAAEALHQCRVALRQLRTAFSLFRSTLDADAVIRFQTEMRWIAVQLADARNLDVLLAQHFDGGAGPASSLKDRVLLAREASYGQAIAAITSPRLQQFCAELSAWLTGDVSRDGKGGQRIGPFAARALSRAWKKLMKVTAGNIDRMSPSKRHRLRIKVKKLRYAAMFFAPLFPMKQVKTDERLRPLLTKLQENLGTLNDLAIARMQLQGFGLTPDEQEEGERVLTGKAGGRKKLLKRARKLHRKLAEIAPFWHSVC